MNTWSTHASPYAPPQAWSSYPPAQPSAATSGGAVYTPNQMLLATFLGTPLAGGILLAINEQRLGRPKGVLPMIGLGIVLAAVVFGLAFLLPDKTPGAPITMLGMGAIRAIAQVRQAERVAQYHAWGGPKASSWAAAGISLAALVPLCWMVFVVAFGFAIVDELRHPTE